MMLRNDQCLLVIRPTYLMQLLVRVHIHKYAKVRRDAKVILIRAYLKFGTIS